MQIGAENTGRSLAARGIRRMVISLVVLTAMLFLPAGTLRFWQAWTYLILMAGLWIYFFLHLLKHDPQLAERRLQSKETEPAQKVFLKLFSVFLYAGFILAGLDFRFGWSRTWLRPVPLAIVVAGQAAVAVGYCFVFWVMKTNTFAASVIRPA